MENKTKIRIQNTGDNKKIFIQRNNILCSTWNNISSDIFAIVMNKTIVLKIIY